MSGRPCFLNNLKMRAVRKEQLYDGIILDLAHSGLIDNTKAIKLLGYQSDPTFIKPPKEK